MTGTRRTVAIASAAVLLCLSALIVLFFLSRGNVARHPVPTPRKGLPLHLQNRKKVKAAPVLKKTKPPSYAQQRILSTSGLRVAKYEGNNRLEKQVWKTTGELQEDLIEAVKDLKDTVGLFPTAADRITFVLKAQSNYTFSEPFFISSDGREIRVELPIEPLVLGWWKPGEILSAALAGAILEKEVPSYSKAPLWFRFGAALRLSGFGETYAHRFVINSDRRPQRLIRPLSDSGELSCLDGYWAIRSFTADRGTGALLAWIETMRAGNSCGQALALSAGENLSDFERNYYKWTSAYLGKKCANRRFLLDQVMRLRLRQPAKVIPALEKFIENHPLDWYAGNARYFLNYARFRRGNYSRAIDGFTDLLVNAPSETSWQAKAHYFLGRSYQLSGYGAIALDEFKEAALSADPLLKKLAKQRLKEVS